MKRTPIESQIGGKKIPINSNNIKKVESIRIFYLAITLTEI